MQARTTRTPPLWRLSLLGAWRLARDGEPVVVGTAAQRLLAFLALRGPCERAFLAGVLWPDHPQTRAQANVRATLSRLRRRRGFDGIVWQSRDVVALDDQVSVDVRTLRATASAVLDGRLTHPGWPTVCELDGDDLLPGWDEHWLLMDREQLRQARLHALEALADQLRTGDVATAVHAALAAVALDPLRESAHRALIRAYLAEGNRIEALRQLGRLRRLLREELGVEPTDRAIALLHGT
jgi:DNA-binding SARP family transcriptional activator